jgi:hypothetical protein
VRERRAGELAVGHLDPEPMGELVHHLDVVRAHPVPEPARTRMDHHAHLPGEQPHRARCPEAVGWSNALLNDLEEDEAARAVVFGLLAEMERK